MESVNEVVDSNVVKEPIVDETEILSKIKEMGFDFKSVDEFKEQLSIKAPEKIPTPDELKASETEFEKRLVNEYLEDGGSPESYAQIKQIAKADPKVLGIAVAKKELIDEGYTEQEAESIVKERYFTYNDQELDEIDSEDEKAEMLKRKTFGEKKLQSKGARIIESAKTNLEGLKSKINHKDNALKLEQKFATEVEGHLANYNKVKEFELGEEDGKQLPSFKFDVDDDTINEVRSEIKSQKQVESLIFDSNDNINIEFITEALINKKLVAKMVKKGYLEGQHTAITKFKETYPEKNLNISLFGKSNPKQDKFNYSGIGKTIVV